MFTQQPGKIDLFRKSVPLKIRQHFVEIGIARLIFGKIFLFEKNKILIPVFQRNLFQLFHQFLRIAPQALLLNPKKAGINSNPHTSIIPPKRQKKELKS